MKKTQEDLREMCGIIDMYMMGVREKRKEN